MIPTEERAVRFVHFRQVAQSGRESKNRAASRFPAYSIAREIHRNIEILCYSLGGTSLDRRSERIRDERYFDERSSRAKQRRATFGSQQLGNRRTSE